MDRYAAVHEFIAHDGPIAEVTRHVTVRKAPNDRNQTRRYAHTDVSAVTPFLDQTLDGRNLPWHGAKDGISGTNPERNPNNKVAQEWPNGSVPVMFEGTTHSSD
ncbi:MAG: hypothetical protein VXX97_03120 [Pseudomonadota bacterium]|nr:hypothetical protein [Pseudomonadota bacterium]